MRSCFVVMVALGLSMGARDLNAGRIVTADETTGRVPSDFSFLTDSIAGQLCNANEDVTGCFATPYTVNNTFISPAAQANGGVAAVNLLDGPGTDTPTNLSDQLYLTVSAPVAGLYTVTWCWDSDLEPNVNICPVPTGATPVTVTEPPDGCTQPNASCHFSDLTSFFTGPNGPLAAGQWQINAVSESPEPSSFFLLGGGLAAGMIFLRKRRMLFRPNDTPKT
jgi:hypothetical protein